MKKDYSGYAGSDERVWTHDQSLDRIYKNTKKVQAKGLLSHLRKVRGQR